METTITSPNEVIESTSSNIIPVKAGELLDLLSGALVATGTDKNLPVLNSVNITCTNGILTATATDRYRLIEGVRILNNEGGQFDKPALVPAKEVTRIIKACKELIHDEILYLTLKDRSLQLSTTKASFWMDLCDGTFPPSKQIIDGLKVTAIEGIGLNPDLLATFSKIPHAKGQAFPLTFNGEGKPISAKFTHNEIQWTALLMPMRSK